MHREVETLTRQSLVEAWADYYSDLEPSKAMEVASANAQALRERMRCLGKVAGYLYHGFRKRDLTRAYGMALSVHLQVLGGLTSSTRGAYPEGRRAGLVTIEAPRALPNDESEEV